MTETMSDILEVENVFGEDGTLSKQIITRERGEQTVITYHPNQEAREIERKVHEAQLETSDEVPEQPPQDNDHVTEGAEQFPEEKVEEEIIILVTHESHE